MSHHSLFGHYDPDETSQSDESHLDKYCQMFCIRIEQTQFHQAVCLIMACLVIIDPDETSQSEESHLDQYCQMFCILLEQTQFQCFSLVLFFLKAHV